MSEQEFGVVFGKIRKLRELTRARALVQQLERELRGERPQREVREVPEFLMRLSRTAFHSRSKLGCGGEELDERCLEANQVQRL